MVSTFYASLILIQIFQLGSWKFALLTVSAQSCQDVTDSINDIISLPETQPAGSIIINVKKSNSINITYTITGSNPSIKPDKVLVLRTYFGDFQNDTSFSIGLNKSLNLQALEQTVGEAVQTIYMDLFCAPVVQLMKEKETVSEHNLVDLMGKSNSHGIIHSIRRPRFKINKQIRVIVNDVNEFDPKLSFPGDLNITENTMVGTVVYSLLDKASDEDRPKSSTTFNFGIHPHRITLLDGMSIFRLNDALQGLIILISTLDYESVNKLFYLNVSVKDTVDTKARTSYVTLKVNVIDVDDQGPEFVYPGCDSPCLVPEYTAITELSYTGPLNVQPAAIRARDLDTMNHPIVYSFYHDISDGFISIDRNNCTIYQVRPASQAKWISQRLVIKAAEVRSSQPEALAILMVRIRERDPALNGTNTIQGEALAEDNGILISAIIALCVVLGLILIASAIVVFLMCYRYRKMVYPEENHPESVTEEEEIQSDNGDEASPDRDPLFTVFQKSRHGILPPLPMKDTGTGTDDAETGNKRRSRKRAKIKEPEIYDGTREYEMQADPEFFSSTDKSKVKRSTRSFHTRSDHIVVSNDNTELE